MRILLVLLVILLLVTLCPSSSVELLLMVDQGQGRDRNLSSSSDNADLYSTDNDNDESINPEVRAENRRRKKIARSDRTLMDQRDPIEIRNTLRDLTKDFPNLLRHAAWRGEPKHSFKIAMREANLHLRANYRTLIKDVGDNVYPLLVLNDGDAGEVGTGSTLTLYTEDGQIHRYVPTDKTYEILKDVSHLMLGVYTYIGPYLKSQEASGWIGPIKSFQNKIQDVINSLEYSGLEPELKERTSRILNNINAYIKLIIEKQRLEIGEFKDLCIRLSIDIEANMRQAVIYQAQAIIPLLKEIKAKLGKEWDQTYFLLPTVWPVAGINIRMQMLETVTTPRHLRTHMITAENAFKLEDARLVLGRVVSDRALAQIAFGTADPGLAKHAYAFSSRQDLMSDYADEEIKKFLENRR